jgi:hypothetical protein
MNLPPTPQRVPNPPPPEGPSSLLACFLAIVADWEPSFPQPRTYRRAEYFLFSRCQWNPAQLFTPILRFLQASLPT